MQNSLCLYFLMICIFTIILIFKTVNEVPWNEKVCFYIFFFKLAYFKRQSRKSALHDIAAGTSPRSVSTASANNCFTATLMLPSLTCSPILLKFGRLWAERFIGGKYRFGPVDLTLTRNCVIVICRSKISDFNGLINQFIEQLNFNLSLWYKCLVFRDTFIYIFRDVNCFPLLWLDVL